MFSLLVDATQQFPKKNHLFILIDCRGALLLCHSKKPSVCVSFQSRPVLLTIRKVVEGWGKYKKKFMQAKMLEKNSCKGDLNFTVKCQGRYHKEIPLTVVLTANFLQNALKWRFWGSKNLNFATYVQKCRNRRRLHAG